MAISQMAQSVQVGIRVQLSLTILADFEDESLAQTTHLFIDNALLWLVSPA
jgi:hypothetical protein